MAFEIDDIIIEQSLKVNGLPVGNPSYFFQEIQDNVTATPIITQGDYESIIGARIDKELQDFTSGAFALTYIGLLTKKFKISASITHESGSTLFHQYSLAIFKNGILQTKIISALDNSVGYPRNTSLNAIIELSENDTIELKVTDLDGDQSYLLMDLQLTGNSI